MTAPITWAEATSPILWSNIGIDWNTPAKANSATFAADVGETHSEEQGIGYSITFGANVGETLAVVPIKPESITMGLTAAQAVGHDHTLAASAIFGANLTSPVTDRLDAVEAVTFTVQDTSTFGPGTTFTDEPVYPITVSTSASDSLLREEVADVTTTWTKVDYPN